MMILLSRHFTLALCIGIVFFFFSCKKNHVCVCGSKVDGVATTFYDTASKAKKSCKALQDEFKMGCELE